MIIFPPKRAETNAFISQTEAAGIQSLGTQTSGNGVTKGGSDPGFTCARAQLAQAPSYKRVTKLHA